ncbi:protein-export membrane protein SecD [Candidatus Uhrbacteria bacterium RIFOXYC2_FULL_47_19]|uniref:Protein translocase subunit SecD n=1 Tax=Candidatus Uhrbacteria bacterium RIFOXYC2_FULL_47_19 TaxID=1802424 RepID=A0A1F7WDY3_9BACT|nr:MAG: protein-export membrane protein SecD [Candidatus Uhrbacteria bacterium RIFOXYC2_FULL_47_19]HCC22101.1 protein translocase subunit SecD [Candidatus Uhrbacteria bacterium]
MKPFLNGLRRTSHGFWNALLSLLLPTTPRGRIRRAVFFIVLLLVFSSALSYPKWWNSSVDRINGWSESTLGLDLHLPQFWELPFVLGLDLQGGTHLVYVADMANIPDSEQDTSIAGVRDVIERRVNSFGVSEPLVQTNKSGNEWRLIVDLAGVSDISEAIKLIGETPILEFKEQNNEPPRALTAEEQADLEASNTAAKSKADDLLARALAGGDFATLATENSDDLSTRGVGGNLDFQSKSGPYSELIDQLLSGDMSEGQVVPRLLEDYRGYHIVRYEEQRESGQEMKASHVLICYAGAAQCESERSKDEALSLARELAGQATPENFAQLAQDNSSDVGTAENGGDLGWFQPGIMVKPFEDATQALEVGSITTEPVETDFGFHVIYKTDARPISEYRLSHIQINKKTAADYVPPADQWKNTQLSGKQLKRSVVQFHPQTNEPQVALEFDSEGKDLFADITGRNVGQPVAIFLDGEAISIPTVNEVISGGEAVISGNFSIQEAKLLAQRLNAGALPVPIHLETQQSVGATLGNDSLYSSLRAGLIGFLVVVLFMLLYYRLPGLIAVVALCIYTAVNLAIYKLIPVTLTLSGIAGLILSLGMAVDANILIFERLKEELQRGRTLQSALEEGFRRAWLSIRDSNLTTLISCCILFYTSSSLIKGFAFTLGIGVLISMFSAITVSRTLLRLVSGWEPLRSELLYLPGLNRSKPREDGSNRTEKK